MPKEHELDCKYLQMASTWSQLSKAMRKKVGCLVVKDGSIISDGYNGTPSGFNNECETLVHQPNGTPPAFGQEYEAYWRHYSISKPEVIHAEANAIAKLAKSTQSSEGATMYITISPCIECAKLIIQCGIDAVVYGELYRSSEGIELLEKAFVTVRQVQQN